MPFPFPNESHCLGIFIIENPAMNKFISLLFQQYDKFVPGINQEFISNKSTSLEKETRLYFLG
jgi:hypothetical protein